MIILYVWQREENEINKFAHLFASRILRCSFKVVLFFLAARLTVRCHWLVLFFVWIYFQSIFNKERNVLNRRAQSYQFCRSWLDWNQLIFFSFFLVCKHFVWVPWFCFTRYRIRGHEIRFQAHWYQEWCSRATICGLIRSANIWQRSLWLSFQWLPLTNIKLSSSKQFSQKPLPVLTKTIPSFSQFSQCSPEMRLTFFTN